MAINKLIRNKQLLYWISKLGYARKNKNLKNLRILNNGRFFIYNIEGFNIASEAFSWYLTKEVLEQEVNSVSCRYYRPKIGDTIVDIGAGLGEETLIYAHMVGETGQVFAIEANPSVYQALVEVITLNEFSNVQHFNIAINNKHEHVDIDDAPESYLSSSLNNTVNQGTIYKVEGIPLTNFCAANNLRSIDLLKVNIEGAERFLEAAFSEPGLDIRNVAISCHDFRFENEGNDFFRTKDLVENFLTVNGYEIHSQKTGKRYIDDWVYGLKKSSSSD